MSTDSNTATSTTHVDTEDAGVVQANGDTVYTTTRTYTDTAITTTVTTTVTTTNTTPVTTVTYSNNTTETLTGETVVTTSTSTKTTAGDPVVTTRTEVVGTRTVEAVVEEEAVTVIGTDVRTESEYWLRLDKEVLTEEMYDFENEVVNDGQYIKTYKTTIFRTPEMHTHVYATDTYTTTNYSDGTSKTEVTQSLRFREAVKKYPADTERKERLLITTELVDGGFHDDSVEPTSPDKDADIGSDHVDMGTRTPGYLSLIHI